MDIQIHQHPIKKSTNAKFPAANFKQSGFNFFEDAVLGTDRFLHPPINL